MTATTMHFGPEWMRTKQAPTRPNPSPPLATPTTTATTTTASAPAGASSYSALVAPAPPPEQVAPDLARPFRYSKEEMLRIFKEGGGRGGLGLEVERWEGIVREVGYDPIGLKEMGEGEKKIFAGPLNSEMRRRQSTDYLSPLTTSGLGERPKLGHPNSAGSPLRERMGNFSGRRRDSTDQVPLTLPRKPSMSSIQGSSVSTRDAPLPSPRVRVGVSGFDGVLSDSWSSKRRASEALSKPGGKTDKEGEGASGVGDSRKIGEEGTDKPGNLNGVDPPVKEPGIDQRPNGEANGSGIPSKAPSAPAATQTNATTSTAESAPPAGPPPGLGIDFAALEWSYLDPQGHIQGPFRGDTMQKWYDEGYFAAELLMRRTHIDQEWTPVRELRIYAGTDKLFLVPLNIPSRRVPEPYSLGTPEAPNFNTPFQPTPSRNLRSSTLDSYLHNESNPSDSPSSSFSAARFGSNSPDPSILARTVGYVHSEHAINTYTAPLDLTDASSNRSSFVSYRAPGDGHGYIGLDNIPRATDSPTSYSPVIAQRAVHDPSLVNGHYNVSASPFEQAAMSGYDQTRASFQPTPQAFAQAAIPSYLSQPLLSTIPERRSSGSPHDITGIPQQQPIQQLFMQPNQVPSSPWGAQEVASPRRPGPFDPNFPTAQNTVATRTYTPPQPVAVSQALHTQISADQSPWYAASKSIADDGWGADATNATVTGPSLAQSESQQDHHVSGGKAVDVPVTATAQSDTITEGTIASSSPAPTAPTGGKKTRQKTAAPPSTAPQTTSAKPAPTPTQVPAKPPSPSPVPESKPAPWAIDEEKVTTPPVMSLREIQEAEAKKAEARKVAERERARAAAASVAASSSSEDVQFITTSWGLPTSQAGARNNGAQKESPIVATSPASPATPPVWTNAPKTPVVKKSMKEIQEEEEKRKKQAAEKKETIAAAARRGYAETTTKPIVASGPWTTVGASGKTSAASVAAAAAAATTTRPTVTTTASTTSPKTPQVPPAVTSNASMASRVVNNGTSARTSATTAAKIVTSNLKVEDTAAPSHDFLKWLSDSLKGLNASVNFEEITGMLLSFPLDPDPSTVELISDLIYANSTTLDGRRFASDFVSRRKASTKASTPAGASGKPLSIADVVKSQPKPAQNEWGGFKVVNKKKKGTRA
ncbi:hypothetical protein C8Q75DRAFT_889367 [Abortiporus biennis]|nr:hypothetical protein C8Q75DRAFT_889367 [Abortiporus biennis]